MDIQHQILEKMKAYDTIMLSGIRASTGTA